MLFRTLRINTFCFFTFLPKKAFISLSIHRENSRTGLAASSICLMNLVENLLRAMLGELENLMCTGVK